MEEYSPLVSVVVPVYGVERYLEKCLDSIVRINYSPFEVILVDDCSPDSCGSIIDRYVEGKDNWTAIHKSHNEGVAKARITGAEIASGEYVMFVDSDDYVHPDILSKLVAASIGNDADVSCCGLCVVNGNSIDEDERNCNHIYDEEGLKNLISTRLLFDPRYKKAAVLLYLVGKLFRNRGTELLAALKEGDGLDFQEDLMAFVSYLIKTAKRIVSIADVLYYYVQRPGSLTRADPVKLFGDSAVLWERLDGMNYPGLKNQLLFRIWYFLKVSLCRMYSLKSFSEYKKFINQVRSEPIVSKYIYANKSRNLPIEIKIHPHFFLIKGHLYWLDYLFSGFIWNRG